MKFFAVLAVLALTGYAVNAQSPIPLSDEQKAQVILNAAKCAAQEKVPREALLALRAGQFSNPTTKLQCFAKCFLERFGFFVNGQVQDAVVFQKLGAIVGADKINTIMSKCNSLRGSGDCDTAFKLLECYFKENAAIL